MTTTATTQITDTNGNVIGRITPTRLAERAPGAPAITYTPAFSADVRNRTGDGWLAPGGVRHYPTAAAAEKAIHAARAAQKVPNIPKGLRLGSNQKHALWLASITRDGEVDGKHGPALAKKGLAEESLFRYRLTELGHQVAAELFDADGNPR